MIRIQGEKIRYVLLDIIKFLMSLIIVIYHYNYICRNYENPYMFHGGYLAVEVFFIISGFLFFFLEVEISNVKEKSIVRCMKHKVAGLYPAYVFSLITAFGIDIVRKISDMDIIDYIKSGIRFAGDALMIGEWGIPKMKVTYNIVTWYISAMLLAFIIWLVILKFTRSNIYIYILIPLILYGYIAYSSGNLRVHGNRTFFLVTDGVLRGIAGIGAGFLAFYLYKILSNRNITFRKMVFYISFISTLLILFLAGGTFADFLIIPSAMVMVASAAALPAYSGKGADISGYLGKFSYFVYLNHWIVLTVMQYVLKEYSLWLYLLVTLLYSFVFMKVIMFLVKNAKRK